jgi:hypothetical protein
MPSSEAGLDLDEEEEAQAPQAIESSFSPIQFKQLSVGKSFSCGIQHMDGKIRCWGTLKGVLRDTDLIESQAPYQQVSVGPHGVCMISEGTNAAPRGVPASLQRVGPTEGREVSRLWRHNGLGAEVLGPASRHRQLSP